MRIYDHIDLRVPDLAAAKPFYAALLPALGFAVRVDVEGWFQFEAAGPAATEFFGIVEDRAHRPNANRIAFWADSKERVDAFAALLKTIGARNIEGPGVEDETELYYAVFFEDPAGNRLEICHRRPARTRWQ